MTNFADQPLCGPIGVANLGGIGGGGGDQEMSAAEADFCGHSSRIPAVKAEVFCEYDNKHRAVIMSVSSHEGIGVSSALTNKPE